MLNSIQKILAAPIFDGHEEKTRKAQYLNIFLWSAIVLLMLLQVWRSLRPGQASETQTSLVVFGLIILMLVLQIVLRRGHVNLASILLLVFAWAALNYQAKSVSGIYDTAFLANVIIVILAGMLLNYWASLGFVVVSILAGWGMAYLQTTGASPSQVDQPYNIARDYTILLTLVAVLSYISLRNFLQTIRHSRFNENRLEMSNKELQDLRAELENRVNERTAEIERVNEENKERAERLRTISEISRYFTAAKNLDELLPEIVSKISESFGFYHVGIFLNDEKDEYTVLRAANSAGGKKMLERGHRLKIGQIGIVGFVTGTGQPRIALDVGEDFVYFNNPDLPNTRSEMALPLQTGGKTIGAFDVQSVARAAFTPDDVNTLSLLADQISISIQNALLFEQTNAALAEIQDTYQRSFRSSWQEITRSNTVGFRYVGGKVTPHNVQSNLPDEGSTPSETLNIPINVRGETLGNLQIRQPGRQHAWTTTESRLYRSIVERMAFALENARLIEDTLNRAAREQKIIDISTKVGSSVRIEQILQTAAEEISRTFEGAEVLVQLQPGTKGKEA